MSGNSQPHKRERKNTTVAPSVARATEFLYAGPDPVQTGVAEGTIDATRAAVVRGRVLGPAGAPLLGVRVAISGHPEFGQTLSRADGMFDLAVNGGGLLTVTYEKSGFLPAQRQVEVPPEDFATAPDAALVSLDPQVTPIEMQADSMQVARGR